MKAPYHHHHRQHASLGHASLVEGSSQPFDMLSPVPSYSRQPVVHLKEEDECPICHHELPAKGGDGSETDREAHVSSCIDAQLSGPAGDISTMSRSGPPVDLSSARRHGQAYDSLATSSPRNVGLSQSHTARRRTTGMVVYNATEKDCVNVNGGGETECVICFEEFTVGDEMGRLECLCRFHHECIRSWWNTKGPGACPVHQQPV